MSSNPEETQTKAQDNGADASADLTVFVEQLLGDMQQKFQQMSEQIIGRLDEMGKRVDDLEHNISELTKQVNEPPEEDKTKQ